MHAHILSAVDMLDKTKQSVFSQLSQGLAVGPWPAFFSLFASLDFLACMATLREVTV